MVDLFQNQISKPKAINKIKVLFQTETHYMKQLLSVILQKDQGELDEDDLLIDKDVSDDIQVSKEREVQMLQEGDFDNLDSDYKSSDEKEIRSGEFASESSPKHSFDPNRQRGEESSKFKMEYPKGASKSEMRFFDEMIKNERDDVLKVFNIFVDGVVGADHV